MSRSEGNNESIESSFSRIRMTMVGLVNNVTKIVTDLKGSTLIGIIVI